MTAWEALQLSALTFAVAFACVAMVVGLAWLLGELFDRFGGRRD